MSFIAPEKNLKSVVEVSGPSDRRIYAFGPFQIDCLERRLLRDGTPVPVTAKAFDTLLFLVSRGDHLVEKSEIMEAIWPDSFVEEGNLSVTVHMLRKALGDDTSEHKYIETVPKRGYRFVGKIREEGRFESDLLPVEPSQIPEPKPSRLQLAAFSVSAPFRVAILTIVALAIVSEALHFYRPSQAVLKIHSLAVLPFHILNSVDNLGDQNYLGLGMADAIITRLGSSGQVAVRPTSEVSRYADTSADPLAAGREQKVDAILSGNIRFLVDRVIVTAQLVRVSNGALLWADTFQESPQRMFALEGEVEERVAQSLSAHISDDGNVPPPKQSQNVKAYQLYLEGRYFWNKRTEDALRRSIEYFQQATIEDPQYAIAYVGIADAYALLGSYGVEPAEQAYPNARSAALKALQLDSSLSEAHASLGMISFYYEWNWPQAEQEFRRSIKLNPNYPMARAWYALSLAAEGRSKEALQEIRLAQELDPVSLIINTEVGRVYYLTGDYDRAAATYRRVIDLDPHFARAHSRLGMAYAALNKFNDAIGEFQRAQELSGTDAYLDGLIGYSYARAGNSVKAREVLGELEKRSNREYVPAFSMALINIGLGERSTALDLLGKSYSDRSTYLVYLKADPLLDTLRADVRFTGLLNRMGLS
jgi:DNA-binding winged helix-turn-helix (wHTH) protein/TolB-like protein/Flp pilus assembly protein TadD